jgi:hypothetical protein
MNRFLPIFLCLTIAIINCSSESAAPANSESDPAPNIANSSIDSPVPVAEETVMTDGTLEPKMIGCWSNGRGELLRTTSNSVIYGFVRKSLKDSPKPVGLVVLDQGASNTALIRLVDRPQFFIFRKYVNLALVKEEDLDSESLQDESFETYEDFMKKKVSGSARWVRDDCKKWYPKWFVKHYKIDS